MRKLLYTIFLIFIISTPAKAVVVNGTITDESQEPLIGASVVYEKESSKGVLTDENGKFTLNDVPENTVLKISYLGYEDSNYTVTSSSSNDVKIQLKTNDTVLNEVEVTAKKPICSDEELEKINARKGEKITPEGEKKAVCLPTKCRLGYKLSDDKKTCIKNKETKETCSNEELEKINASKGEKITPNGETVAICVPIKCKSGYELSEDEKTCTEKQKEVTKEPKLSEEDSKKKIQELEENAKAMKEKEQSTANKLLGAASIGATGIGAMQALSALSEQGADEDAEMDMTAYLATFRCDFGQGKNIKGGETDIVLPGGNQLTPLYQEYVKLAADLKIRKESLGMTPGIESEEILDKANIGLYDDVSLGKTDGVFTSVAAALSDPTSSDAAEWAEQKSDTSKQLKTGLITAGVGAIGGLVGDIVINRKSAKESSDEINAKYEALKKLEEDTSSLPDQEEKATCPSGSTGTFSECSCQDSNQIYNSNENVCEPCKGDTKPISKTECGCLDGTIPTDDNKCIKSTITPKCDLTDTNMKLVDNQTGDCECQNGFRETSDGRNCECPSQTHEINEQGLCIQKTVPTIVVPEKTVLYASNLFKLGSYELAPEALLAIGEFAGQVKGQTSDDNVTYCITVVGHTDKTGTNATNEKLSKNRASAVKTALVNAGVPTDNIKSYGLSSNACTAEFRSNSDGCTENNNNCAACRKVEIEFSDTACTNK